MTLVGQLIVVLGLTGLFWFGVPTILAISSVFASRSTGQPVSDETQTAIRDGLYRLSGSVVAIAAGATLIYLG